MNLGGVENLDDTLDVPEENSEPSPWQQGILQYDDTVAKRTAEIFEAAGYSELTTEFPDLTKEQFDNFLMLFSRDFLPGETILLQKSFEKHTSGGEEERESISPEHAKFITNLLFLNKLDIAPTEKNLRRLDPIAKLNAGRERFTETTILSVLLRDKDYGPKLRKANNIFKGVEGVNIVSHKEAIAKITRIFGTQQLRDRIPDGSAIIRAVPEDKGRELFFPAVTEAGDRVADETDQTGGVPQKDIVREHNLEIERRVGEMNVKYENQPFWSSPVAYQPRGLIDHTQPILLEIPREVETEDLDMILDRLGMSKDDPETAAFLSMSFLTSTHDCYRRISTSKTQDPHLRATEFIGKMAAYTNFNSGDPQDFSGKNKQFRVAFPKLLETYFANREETEGPLPEAEKQKIVAEIIDSYLSLIFPDRAKTNSILPSDTSPALTNLAQEDFISNNLIALAKTYGIENKYRSIFDAMDFFRKAQFNLNLLVPNRTNPLEKRKMEGMIEIVLQKTRELQRKPHVLEFGYGDNILLTILSELGLIEKSLGLEINRTGNYKVGRDKKGDITSIKIPIAEDPEKTAGIEEGIIKKEFDRPPDMIFAIDALHETQEWRIFYEMLYRCLSPGGSLVIVEPTCLTGDKPARESMFPSDSTLFEHSILVLEYMLNIMTKQGLENGATWKRGWALAAPLFGCVDLFTRIFLVQNKPHADSAYFSTVQLTSDEQITEENVIQKLKVSYPFSLLIDKGPDPDKKFREAIKHIDTHCFPIRSLAGIPPEKLFENVIRRLLEPLVITPEDSSPPEMISKILKRLSPMRGYMKEYEKTSDGKKIYGDTSVLKRVNRDAAIATAIALFLQEHLPTATTELLPHSWILDRLGKQIGWGRLVKDVAYDRLPGRLSD